MNSLFCESDLHSFFFMSDDDEDVVRRDGAHLLIVLFVRIKKEN